MTLAIILGNFSIYFAPWAVTQGHTVQQWCTCVRILKNVHLRTRTIVVCKITHFYMLALYVKNETILLAVKPLFDIFKHNSCVLGVSSSAESFPEGVFLINVVKHRWLVVLERKSNIL